MQLGAHLGLLHVKVPELIYSMPFLVTVEPPNCNVITPQAGSLLLEMMIRVGDQSSNDQPLPAFTDSAGYIADELCILQFDVLLDGQAEDFLTVTDDDKILLTQPNRLITGSNFSGKLVVKNKLRDNPDEYLNEMSMTFSVIINAPDCS